MKILRTAKCKDIRPYRECFILLYSLPDDQFFISIQIVLDCPGAIVYLSVKMQHDALSRPSGSQRCTHTNHLRWSYPSHDQLSRPAKSGLSFCGVYVQKVLTIIQLAIVAGIVVYGTISLYRGDFEAAYATFPFCSSITYGSWPGDVEKICKKPTTMRTPRNSDTSHSPTGTLGRPHFQQR